MEITGREVHAINWMMVKPPSRTPAGDLLTVVLCGVIDLTQLRMNLDRQHALYIQKLYHRPHFTVGRNWNKSLHPQPL